MCFSAPVSFTAGAVLVAAGVLTVKMVQKKTDLPLASVPIFFGIQQLMEGVVWLSFNNSVLNTVFTYLFVLLAYVFWPVYIPFAILAPERSAWRKKILMVFLIIGILAAISMLFAILSSPVTSYILKNSVCYNVQNISLPIGILYILPLTLTYFFSSSRFIRFLGIFAVFSLFIAYFFYSATYASVWCFFSAIISLSIFWHFKSLKK